MNPTRRAFLSSLGNKALDMLVPSARADAANRHTLVCVFLRGGMDALNTVIPHGDPHYYDKRPTLAVPEPGISSDSAIDLNGFFGLHPSMSALKAAYDSGDLAIVHATGAPFASRSHFAAQKSIESGRENEAGPYSGWLARHLTSFNSLDQSPFRAIAIGHALPKSLHGTRAASALTDVNGFHWNSNSNHDFAGLLYALYGEEDLLGQQAADTFKASATFDLYAPASYLSESADNYPNTQFGDALLQSSQYIKSGIGTEIICINAGGWDHHNNLVARLPQKLTDLSEGITAFYDDMGERMRDITMVIMSEFGRRVHENASGGADHGSGACMFILGAGVNGGQVYADWPGLADQQLYQGDLDITIDYRTVLSELLANRMGNKAIDQVFPDFTPIGGLGLVNAL